MHLRWLLSFWGHWVIFRLVRSFWSRFRDIPWHSNCLGCQKLSKEYVDASVPKNKSIPYLFCTEQTQSCSNQRNPQITWFSIILVWLFGDYPTRYRKDLITHVYQNAPCFWPIRLVDEAMFATPPFTRKFHLLGDIWILGWNTTTISPTGGPKNGGKHGGSMVVGWDWMGFHGDSRWFAIFYILVIKHGSPENHAFPWMFIPLQPPFWVGDFSASNVWLRTGKPSVERLAPGFGCPSG